MQNEKIPLRDCFFLAGYVGLIYGTLGLAPSMTRFFSSRLGYKNFNILITGGIAFILASCIFIFYRQLKSRTIYFYIKLTALLGVYAFMLLRWTSLVAEKLHLLEYGLLSYFVLRAVRGVRNAALKYTYVIAIVGCIGYCDELIQKFLPNRVYDLKDVALNLISGILGLAFFELFNNGEALSRHEAKLKKE